MQYKRFLTIDTDTKGLYGAYFEYGKLVGTVSIPFKEKSIDSRLDECYNTLATYLTFEAHPEAVYSEDQFFYNKATHKSVKKLTYFTGIIKLVCVSEEFPHHLITPQEWKGSLKDDIVRERVNKQVTLTKKPNIHVYDAIGMGLYKLGRF